MGTLLRTQRYTFDEFCALVDDGQKADLIDGVIYLASPNNTDANALNVWLLFLIAGYVYRKKLGEVFVSRVAYRLDKTNAPEPDISFVKKSRLGKVKRGAVAGPPDLALEMVSPDSVERDYEEKRGTYERFGVKEYWIVDELEQKLTVFRLSKNGEFKQVAVKDGVLRSKVIPGFWLREAWLWESWLPDPNEKLAWILGESRQ